MFTNYAMFVLFSKYYDDEANENKTSEACSTHGEVRKAYKILVWEA
jgi:hypothetical protein